MTAKLNILIVQSTSADTRFVESAIGDEHADRFHLICATTLEKALDQLAVEKFSLILLSGSLPSTADTEFIIRMLEDIAKVPVLFLSALLNESEDSPSLNQSARSILTQTIATCAASQRSNRSQVSNCRCKQLEAALNREKEQVKRLLKSIENAAIAPSSKHRAQPLTWQATRDPLTELANRQHFVEQLSQASHQPGRAHVMCYLDLDHFKVVNDTCGHAAGDQLLRQVSQLLSANIRQSDLLARLGGDEFGLIIYNCLTNQAHAIVCKLCNAIQKFRFLWQGKVFSIGVSIGLVPIPPEGMPAAQLMSRADAACYAAKNKGRNQVQIYSKDDADIMQMSADFEWFSTITQALEEDRFCLYFQEIRPTDLGKETVQEILLRLRDARTGELMLPMSFIPPAERYDLMPKLDQWVIRQCFKQLESTHTPGILYSINLSGDTLNDDKFGGFLRRMLAEFRLDPHRICFEITETSAIANLAQVATTILKLKKLGFRFALDDFGSGMSSFVYLKQLPVDYLKIDGSLVSEINQDEVALATFKAINDIGHIMGLKTVAEYVSDEEIQRTVEGLNVDYLQGFAIAKPHPFEPASQPLLVRDRQPLPREHRLKVAINNRR